MSVDNIFGDERLELSDLLSHVLDKGVVLKGEVMLAVADIDLVRLDLGERNPDGTTIYRTADFKFTR